MSRKRLDNSWQVSRLIAKGCRNFCRAGSCGGAVISTEQGVKFRGKNGRYEAFKVAISWWLRGKCLTGQHPSTQELAGEKDAVGVAAG